MSVASPSSRARPTLQHAEPWIGPRPGWHPLRALAKIALVLLWSVPAILLQLLLLPASRPAAQRFARFYWRVIGRLLGLRVRVLGQRASPRADGRPVVYVSNHSSWLDISVLGGRLDGCFIAKGEVARWPLIGTIARLGRTVYVRRSRASTGRERDEMQARLAAGDNLILFPEGTTSDGARVLPFRSAFLSIAGAVVGATGLPPIVQPVAVVYDQADGLPVMRAQRPLFAWYGDMEIGSHLWRLAQHRGLRATVLLLPTIDPAGFTDRKALTRAIWQAVAEGAAEMRQNREPNGNA
ncbi:MAG TPA: lysophospholipid acyltransferase family protein [Acetobacteraceae bacterium]|nr:lysophospholipid acyltransferase family protein [Acetobacteraceae bacterium]